MSNFGDHPTGFFGDSSFYNGVATQSLRIDKASGAYLTRTPGSASNRRTFTFSMWLKKVIVFISEANDQNNPLVSIGTANSFFLMQFSGQGQGSATDTVNELQVYDYDEDDTTDYGIETNRASADPSTWFHLVVAIDTTQASQANRIKFYYNGELLSTTTGAHHGAVVQNREFHVNEAKVHELFRRVDATGRVFDGWVADFNFVDGTQYDASYFGETKNGVWIPKEPNVTYGTNGYRLQFKQTGTGTASASTIGADTSGNNNHFTSAGIAASDCNLPDCPENNFCLWNPISTNHLPALTEGSLKNGGTHNTACSGTFGVTSGKWYWEERWLTDANSSGRISFSGVTSYQMENNPDVSPAFGSTTGRSVYRNQSGDHDYKNFNQTSRTQTSGGTYWGGAVVSFRLDMDAGTFKVYTNNSLVHTDSSIPTDGTVIFPLHTNPNSGYSRYNSAIVNFGQDSSFAGNETAQGNTDGNGNGDFFYAVPTGHLALCSANLPEPTIGPNSSTQADNYFNTALWSGNSSTQDVVVGFQPDWVWLKVRNHTYFHELYDSSRGATKKLRSNNNSAEATQADGVTDFTASGGGFSLGAAAGANESGKTYVAWNWKANGGTKTTNDASATSVGSIDSDIQANTTAGFSIVQFETNSGTSGSAQTVAHGLSAAPTFMILKSRDQAGTGWMTYYGDNTDYVLLNGNNATTDGASTWNDTSPTSTVFSIGTNGGDTNNTNGGSMIAYIFHDVEGYSKFGSYTGNGSADGPFVFTGFKPAWVMIKNTARGADWRINDTTRQTINKSADTSGGFLLLANSNSSEITNEYDIDFLSNGFKLRSSDVYENGDGETLIYMAFAEAPFKYSNAH